MAQSDQGSNPSTITASTSIILVPTILSDLSGNPVATLGDQPFAVFDNGLPVKVFGERASTQPIAVVVVMQTGGNARTLFQNYEHLSSLVHSALGSTPHEMSLVTFDSHAHKTATFPLHFDYLEHAMTHPDAGDRGAAVLDAVNTGLDLFDREPAYYRRILILLSQQNDVGSAVSSQLLLQKIANTGATVYSFTFPGSKKARPDKRARQADEMLTGRIISGGGKRSQEASVSLSQADAIDAELMAMKTESGRTLATLSGGEAFQIEELETGFAYLKNALGETYMLSFSPASRAPGLHLIKVKLRSEAPSIRIRSRLFYWNAARD